MRLNQGGGDYQLTLTTFEATEACSGDCDDDGSVSMDELLAAVDVSLGQEPPRPCSNADFDRNGVVTINELIAAVRFGLGACVAS